MTIAENQSAVSVCWSCASSLVGPRPLCGTCGQVQPPPQHADYFAVFDLPRKLNIDLVALEQQFYRLSRKLHPDLHARVSRQEQEWSTSQTSLLNDAYRTLKAPLSRTEYLLKSQGVEIADEKSVTDGKRESRVPEDLLEEVFELNMQLEEMRANRETGEDDPQIRQDLERAKEQFDSQLATADLNLRALWTRWDDALEANDEHARGDTTQQMTALLDRRRYISNLVRDVNEALGA